MLRPRTLKLTIAYDGTAYAGWQRQANATAIQAVIEDEIAVIVGARAPLVAAGRTDAGVHAAGQVASVTIDHSISCDDFARALNARLPPDIYVRHVEETFDRFDARTHAVSKTYRYAIWNGRSPGPFLRHVVWHVPQALDTQKMAAAALVLVGEHDFAAFQGAGSAVTTTTRRVLASQLCEVGLHDEQPVYMPALAIDAAGPGAKLLRYEVTGTGFLRYMVRTIVGTLVDIGRGHIPADEMAAVLASRTRARAGITAPPQGLMLWEVNY